MAKALKRQISKQGVQIYEPMEPENPVYQNPRLKSVPIQNPADISAYENALKTYDWRQLEELIENGADYTHSIVKLNEEPEYTCALYDSSFYYQNDIVELIKHKHEETGRDPIKFRAQCTVALWGVCINNNWELVTTLVKAGADIEENNHPHKAAENGTWRVLEEIKRAKPNLDLNVSDRGNNTPLYYASQKGHIHTINWLLANGANVNEENTKGNTALHIACRDSDENAVHLLIKHDADVNAVNHKGETPVLIAAGIGKEGRIGILARAKANLDRRDDDGNFPLLVACENGHTNAIEELITNGASLNVTNKDRYNCLERAIHSRKDSSAAMCVRLDPSDDFLYKYIKQYEEQLIDLVKDDLIETLTALLDRMVVSVKSSGEKNIKGEVLTKYLDIDNKNNFPGGEGYEKNETYLLQRISQLGNNKLAYHGTIRLLVKKKMNQFGYLLLAIKTFFYILFLWSLGYSLVLASYLSEPGEMYSVNFANGLRLAAELFTIFYFITNVVTEVVEFIRVAQHTSKHLNGKKNRIVRGNEEEDLKSSSKWKIKKFLGQKWNKLKKKKDKIYFRIFADYFSDKSNYWDVLGLLTLFLLFILRLSRQPIKWVFATITFFINSMRVFKLVVLIPKLGPYSTIIYKVLKNDVPKFAALFTITLFTFTGTFFVALRTPYTVQGLLNATLEQDTKRVEGIDDEAWWVLFSGLRILVQGNVFEEMYNNYIYKSLNWLAATVYLSFLFLTLIVYINVFIAQLTDTYAKFKSRAAHRFAWQKLNFIIQLQRTSFLSLFIDMRKRGFTKSIKIDKNTLNEYYNVNDIKHLNMKSFNEQVDVKNMLSSIQTQQKTSEKVKSAIDATLEQKIKTNEEHLEKLDRKMDSIDKRTQQIFDMLVSLNLRKQAVESNQD